jgi:hypothetical protein
MSLDIGELRRIAVTRRRLNQNLSEVSEVFARQTTDLTSSLHELGAFASQAGKAASEIRRTIHTHPLAATGAAFAAGWLVSAVRAKPRQPQSVSNSGSLAGLLIQGLIGLAPAILEMLMTEVLTRQRRPDTF